MKIGLSSLFLFSVIALSSACAGERGDEDDAVVEESAAYSSSQDGVVRNTGRLSWSLYVAPSVIPSELAGEAGEYCSATYAEPDGAYIQAGLCGNIAGGAPGVAKNAKEAKKAGKCLKITRARGTDAFLTSEVVPRTNKYCKKAIQEMVNSSCRAGHPC